jgi:hypothetical protein
VLWAGTPAARRYLVRGWRALLGPAVMPRAERVRAAGAAVLFQRFLRQRGAGRWLAHQALFWGVVSATLITFPLTFGWIHFRAVSGSASAYRIYVLGFRTVKIDALGMVGWLAFHGLNFSAVAILAGASFFGGRRWRQRGHNVSQLGRDLLPLVALMAISVTGLLLTASSALADGFGYRPIAILHMATVVLTLVWVPFGKLFHSVQRPAMAGVHLHKQAGIESGTVRCRNCDARLEGAVFLADLKDTMAELSLDFAGWVHTCPACKHTGRGAQYLQAVKAGFR